MGKVSGYSENTNPATGDFVLGETAAGPATNRFKFLNLITLFFNNIPSTVITAASMVGTKLRGISGTLVGGSGPAVATGQYYTQCGTDVQTTNSGGAANIVFPTSFPNGVVTVVVCPGDVTAGIPLQVLPATVSTSGYSFVGPANFTLRINWIAIGW